MVLPRDKRKPGLLDKVWFTLQVTTNLNSAAIFLLFGREPQHPHGLPRSAEKNESTELVMGRLEVKQ